MHHQLCRSLFLSVGKKITLAGRTTSGLKTSVKLYHVSASRCPQTKILSSKFTSSSMPWDSRMGVRHLSLSLPGRSPSPGGASINTVAFIAPQSKLDTTTTMEATVNSAAPLTAEDISDSVPTLESIDVQEVAHFAAEEISDNVPILENISIPEPPSIPMTTETVELMNTLSEPPFSHLDLGGYTPVGLVQNALEWLHIGLDLPWWTCIVIGTLTIRTVLFPLVIKGQRHNARVANNSPQMQVLQQKMTQARQSGNALQTAQLTHEMQIFMKEKDINPFKGLILPLAQAPIFISVFMGLREMASVPVESMTAGGLFTFTDLTVCDPYYILPILTSATLFMSIEMGANFSQMNAQNMGLMKYVLRALPVIMFPFMMHFPAALTLYWLSANVITGFQVGLFKIPKVRDYFQIEARRNFDSDQMQVLDSNKKKGFRESASEGKA